MKKSIVQGMRLESNAFFYYRVKKTFFMFFILILFPVSLFVNVKTVKAAAPDFIVGPAKNEILVKPGETKKISFAVINRLGSDTNFIITVKKLLVDGSGNLTVSDSAFDQKIVLPAKVSVKTGATQIVEGTIQINKNSEIGSSAFGIFVEPFESKNGEINSHTRAQITNIVDVLGDAVESGALTSFGITDKKVLRMDYSVPFSITYANTGSKNLNPYGIIVVKNIFGKEVSVQKIDPWYVMPKSERVREISVSTNGFFGRYTAAISLNRGYGDLVDTKEIVFYVLPFWAPIILVIVLVAIIFWFTKRGALKGALIAGLLLVGVVNAHAQMSSGNYKVQFDSVNFGGGLSTSTSYTQESTFGEVATGESSSTNYNIHAGYQQMNEVYLSISDASDVTLAPDLGSISGGTADGSTSITVATDGAAGYALYVNASTSPALASLSDSFADYVQGGVNPDFAFSFLNTESFFGFSPEGNDIISNFKDDGSSCGVGALDTTNSCWSGFSTSTKQIASKTSANTPAGTATALKLRAAAGTDRNQSAGSYSGDITFTATAL
ncbi:MAG: hypothetical protein WA051_00660 [Minisyncoccia bacterium]